MTEETISKVIEQAMVEPELEKLKMSAYIRNGG